MIQLLGALSLSTTASCGNLLGGDCVLLQTWGIDVTVIDANTRMPLTSGVTVRLRSGDYVETARGPQSATEAPRHLGAADRPGLYEVEVTAPGYRTETRPNVFVEPATGCSNVRTTRLSIALTPVQ